MSTDHIYSSFLLRLQPAQDADRPTWLVSLQSTKTGQLRWFPNLDALLEHLRSEFGSQPEGAENKET